MADATETAEAFIQFDIDLDVHATATTSDFAQTFGRLFGYFSREVVDLTLKAVLNVGECLAVHLILHVRYQFVDESPVVGRHLVVSDAALDGPGDGLQLLRLVAGEHTAPEQRGDGFGRCTPCRREYVSGARTGTVDGVLATEEGHGHDVIAGRQRLGQYVERDGEHLPTKWATEEVFVGHSWVGGIGIKDKREVLMQKSIDPLVVGGRGLLAKAWQVELAKSTI